MKPKTYKGIYYFNSWACAHMYATTRRWRTDRIIAYERGWAIQKRISGPYYGPTDEPNKGE